MVVGEFAEKRDLIIIGGGPGGYNAAIRAAQLGLKVTLVEQNELGGVCLNSGCIPSKVYAQAAKKLEALGRYASFGIAIDEPTFAIESLNDYKNMTIERLRKGVEELCKANQIELIRGKAQFINQKRLGIEMSHHFDVYDFEKVIIATGSTVEIPTEYRAAKILTEAELYRLTEIPPHLIIYGHSYIALEAAFTYRQLGADVTLILNKENFSFDESINRELQRLLKKQKIKVYRDYQLKDIAESHTLLQLKLSKSDQEITCEGSHVFMEGTHHGNIETLDLQRIGVECTTDGFIKVNQQLQTNIPTIYAIGDVTGGGQSAVKSIKEGKVVAERIAGLNSEVDLSLMPAVVHTIPPLATVGMTEQEAKEKGLNIAVSQFNYSGNGYAMVTSEKSGIMKIIKDADNDVLLGFHAIGSSAIELISTAVTAMELVGRDEDLNFPLYPHPSFNETILEAIEGLNNRAIHMKPNEKKSVKV